LNTLHKGIPLLTPY